MSRCLLFILCVFPLSVKGLEYYNPYPQPSVMGQFYETAYSGIADPQHLEDFMYYLKGQGNPNHPTHPTIVVPRQLSPAPDRRMGLMGLKAYIDHNPYFDPTAFFFSAINNQNNLGLQPQEIAHRLALSFFWGAVSKAFIRGRLD
jgi:hypothetical protein